MDKNLINTLPQKYMENNTEKISKTSTDLRRFQFSMMTGLSQELHSTMPEVKSTMVTSDYLEAMALRVMLQRLSSVYDQVKGS